MQLHRADRHHLDRDRAPQPLPDPDPRRRPLRRLRDRGGARPAAEPGGDAGRDVDWSWLDPATDGICNLQRHHAHGELTNRAANRPRAEGQDADGAAAMDSGIHPARSGHRSCWWRCCPRRSTLAQGTAVFSRIDVAGNQRIEADTIRVFAGIEPGQPVTPEQLNLAVRQLFETGLFEDVHGDARGRAAGHHRGREPDDQPDRLRGQRRARRRQARRGDPAPAAARLLGRRRPRRTRSASSRPTAQPAATPPRSSR